MDINLMVKNYEATLQNRLTAVLNLQPENVTVHWDSANPSAEIKILGSVTTVYTFTFDKEKTNLTMAGYAFQTIGETMITGINVRPVGIDFNAFAAIRAEFIEMETDITTETVPAQEAAND